MAIFTEPKKWGVIPGSAADVGEIQEKGSTLYPSIADLWPAIYQLALSKGGKAPERTGFNAFLKMIMERLYFIERGGVWSYDATADYPAGAVVGYSGGLYLALKDNGEGTDAGAVQPDADGEVWQRLETAADLAKALLGYLSVAAAESDYLKKSDASDTYLSKDDASDTYLSKDDASDTYLSKTDAAADYLKQSDASDTYLSKEDASDTYLPKEDLSSQIIASVRSNWYTAYPDGAEAHNAMWGGRDITAAFNAGTVSERIADGTFKDIFPGDYITKQVTISGTAYTVNWVIADCDYRLGQGDTETTAHHVVIVPETPIFKSKMNSDNTTENSYNGSYMHKTVIPTVATGLKNAFGDHIITFRDRIPTYCTNVASRHYLGWTGGSAPYGDWVTETCNLMNELMVYGCQVYGQSGVDVTFGFRQLSAFRLSTKLINPNRTNWWLRDAVSSAGFARVDGVGLAGAANASNSLGVRPFALLV